MAALSNPNHERFCLEYVKDTNATQAAIRAGYSVNAARQQGSRLLANVAIQRRVAELQDGIEKRAMVDADWVIGELVKIAKADIRKFYNLDGTLKNITELDDECAAALSGAEAVELGDSGAMLRKIKRWDRTKVLELLGKHFGLWPQKVEHNISWLDGMSADDLRIVRDLLQAVAERRDEDPRGDRPTSH